MTINFNQAGSFNGITGGVSVLNNPTSLQFGPDGRLYVSEQNGTINAFTVELQNGEFIATDHEVLVLPNGDEVVGSIQNHNDDGSLSNVTDRQVTGFVVTGTAENPVLYISSSDPRISVNGEVNLDTNSGIITRVTFNGEVWEAVDIIRGLPRSEENHSVNGLVLSPDGTQLFLTVGGNTNNGAPSQFFSNTAEFALSGTVLEIDLADIESRPILTDPDGGQNGTPRQFIYDLPTLDDPSVPNDGIREDVNGLDVNGPFGGNDGFNQAILPADAPFRIFADGLRNAFDLAFTANGNLFTVDNGSNTGLGGNPLDANGNETGGPGAGAPTNAINNGGTGDPEPLFLLEDGGFFGHPVPIRANQDLELVIFDDDGNPDASVTPNSFPNASALVPDSVDIADGFIIDPSRFTGDATRLADSGIRIERNSPETNALTTLGSSSNGLIAFEENFFDGALQGALLVTQFNGNVTVLNVNDAGTGLDPLIDPGEDGVLGTADDFVLAEDGVFSLITGQSQPLDVTVGPDGAIFVAEFGTDNINAFLPSGTAPPVNLDFDGDGILNVDDPFLRDETNGGSAVLTPGQSLLFDFDANQDNNLVGPNGFGGGLTGVAINGVTDFEQFFQAPSPLPDQIVNLDNVKFTTAAGGGTTVIEAVSNGDPIEGSNNGEFLFHTGVTIAPEVDTFTIKWSVFNPAEFLTQGFQQIGGYIGTGDQSNYLKIVAIQGLNSEIQVLLEDGDTVVADVGIQADDLFSVPPGQQIFFELEIDSTAETATPTITYELGDGSTSTVFGPPIDLSNTAVLDAILGNNTVQGQASGLAVGLFSSNNGAPTSDAFQAVFNDIEITASEDAGGPPTSPTVSVVGGPLLVGEDESQVQISLLADVTVPSNESVAVTFEIVPNTATPGADYDYQSATATFDPQTGVYTDTVTIAGSSSDVTVLIDILQDAIAEGNEAFTFNITNVSNNAQIGTASASVTIEDDDGANSGSGAAVLTVTEGSNNVQVSTFGANSFQLTNTGDQAIEQIELDITNALFPDTVFDPFGLAGDTVSRTLTIDTDGNTGVVTPSEASFIGEGGTAGFEGIQILFDENTAGGFNPGETLGFSVDLDGNSIAGADQGLLVEGSDPTFDVGGVSGAELIGSLFTVTFSDGTTATGQLQSDGTQGGAQALASQASPGLTTALTVNGLGAGGVGTYDANGPTVVVNGPAGQTARVVLTKGFIQPTNNAFFDSPNADDQAFAPVLQAQLDALAAEDFPANNAVEFQTIDILLTGEDQDISGLFDFADVANFDFAGEDQLPLGFVASLIDPANDDLPLGPVTQPIYLQFDEQTTNPPDNSTGEVLFRVNAGGPEIAATDGGPAWAADTNANNSAFLADPGSNNTASFAAVEPGTTVPGSTPGAIFDTERWDQPGGSELQYAFDVSDAGLYEVRLFFGNGFTGTDGPGDRIFDVALEGAVPSNLNDVDLSGQFGHLVGGVITNTVTVNDGTLNIDFIHDVENPLINGIEIIQLDEQTTDPGNPDGEVLFRVNAGGLEIAAIDGGPAWAADTSANNSAFLADPGSNDTASFAAVDPGAAVPDSTPGAIFDTERWDQPGGSELQYAFDVPDAGLYEVRLFFGNGFTGTDGPGDRVFDVALEGAVPSNLNDVDLSGQFGHLVGGVITNTVTVNDGTLNIDFIHVVENPLINGIEIIQLA